MQLVGLIGEFNHLLLCGLLLKLHFVASDGHHAPLVSLALSRDHLKAHQGISRPPDEIDDFI